MTTGWGVRLGLHLVKGIGEQHEALLAANVAEARPAEEGAGEEEGVHL